MTVAILIFSCFLALNLVTLTALLMTRTNRKRRFKRMQVIRGALAAAVFDTDTSRLTRLVRRHPKVSLMLWRDLQSAVTFHSSETGPINLIFRETGVEKSLLRMLRSRRGIRRYEAAQMIRPLVSSIKIENLIDALEREKHEYIRLVLVKALIATGLSAGFDGIARSIDECSIGYFKSVCSMLESTDSSFIYWAKSRLDRTETGQQVCILSGAKTHRRVWLEQYVSEKLDHDDPKIRRTALDTAEASYPYLLKDKLESGTADIITIRAGIKSIPAISYPLDIDSYSRYLADPTSADVAVSAMTSYVSRHPDEIDRFLALMQKSENPDIRGGLARTLVGRLPFLLTMKKTGTATQEIIQAAVESGRSAGLIAYLNQTRDIAIRDWIIQRIRPVLEIDIRFKTECARFFNDDLRKAAGISSQDIPRSDRKIPLTRGDRIALAAICIAIVVLPAAGITFALSGATIGRLSILAREIFRMFNYGFAFYAIALNIIYILLIGLARQNLQLQYRYWSVTDREYLFTPGILPSISVLAPAYNEEKTVIESVYSLLTMEYPDYQVIVINDGSADDTIGVLKREFELEHIDPETSGMIPTAPVKGVYRSPKNEKLLVIDKVNGGKADALNTGINLASREYICSIDSDSLLEPDALLRMTTRILTTDTETIAVGGNILPVNGCTVARGMLQDIGLSKNSVARLQTIEYLRSFIAGRLGWAQLNSLLIISGAFGLFRRERVLEIGGYMTGKGVFQRDTVGEDMELVVRLVRYMREKKNKYRIQYAASANCWTEVPEDLGSLYKQRDRWHRGLVEIMTYHKKMLFNKKYGSAGLVAFPYFVIFEFIGPFYELAGYPLMIVGFLTGALHPPIFLVMFSAILLFGLFISMTSLVLCEKDVVYFRGKELALLLGYTMLENFGFRQVMGWVRVFSLVGMLVKDKGWQKLKRKGFLAAG